MQPTKQFVCGRSKAILSVLLLISSTYSFGMDTEQIEGRSVEFLKKAYLDAPDEVVDIVELLKDPNYAVGEIDRYCFFGGITGTGKTTIALAIAAVTGWRPLYRLPVHFQTGTRNEGADALMGELQKVVESGEKVLYIVDEINGMLDYPASESHDNDATSKALWPFLDAQLNNSNFYFIGIANDYTRIAQQLKDRGVPNTIIYSKIFSSDQKRETFLKNLVTDRAKLAPDCTDEFIDCALKDVKDSTERKLRSIAMIARGAARRANRKSYCVEIEKKHILDAPTRDEEMRDYYDYSYIEQSDYKQRELQHKDNIDQHEKHHRHSIAKQDQLFILQQLIAVTTSGNQTDEESSSFMGIFGKSRPSQISNKGASLIVEYIKKAGLIED